MKSPEQFSAPGDPRIIGGIRALDRDFAALAEAVGAAMRSLAGLTPRECTLLCLAADVCNQTLGLPFRMHVEAALASGASRWDLREVLLHLAPEAG
jgi:alkylhydroperoxidase/carboxymuconolactone decarboxylase family protein YurZ